MPRPRNVTDEQILAEARACFLEQGAAVSTQVIAERLGVSHAVLFQRFGTKDQLMRAALTPEYPPAWLVKVQAGPSRGDLRAQLLELASEIQDFYERIIPCVAMLRSAGMTLEAMTGRPEDRPPVKARRELVAWFERAAKAGQLRPVKADHAADLLLGALQVRPFQRHVSGRVSSRADHRAYVEFAVEVLWGALKPQGGES